MLVASSALACSCGRTEPTRSARQAVDDEPVPVDVVPIDADTTDAAPIYDAPYVGGGMEISADTGTELTLEEIAAENDEAAARSEERRSLGAWAERVRSAVRPDSSLVIVRQAADDGGILDGRFHADRVEIVARLSGPELPAAFELVQYASAGRPFIDHGLRMDAGQQYLVIVSESAVVDGTYELLLNFTASAYGWGVVVDSGIDLEVGPRAATADEIVAAIEGE